MLSHPIQYGKFEKRIESLQRKIKLLSSLRRFLNLSPPFDITKKQWSVLCSQLHSLERGLLTDLDRKNRKYLPLIQDPAIAKKMNNILGKFELQLSKAFVFFDTFLDVLSQRASPELGKILAGCDTIASDGLGKNHPALRFIGDPIVYFDRGFGASILRSGVPLPTGTLNELPLIQVPYNRIIEKWNLVVGILHESGHEALVRLNIVSEFPKVLYTRLVMEDAPRQIKQLLPLWTKEIGPDFWGFCSCGMAQTAGIKEILSLSNDLVFRVSYSDPHPPPWIRVLLSIEWCKTLWGLGIWDRWQREWLKLYPLSDAPLKLQSILKLITRYFSTINDVLFNTKFSSLQGKTLPSLFDMNSLKLENLEKRVKYFIKSKNLNLVGLSTSTQVALFRLLREKQLLDDKALDKIMSNWLMSIAYRREVTQTDFN